MPLLGVALALSIFGSCGGLLVASSLLLFTQRIRTRLIPWLVSYAVGTLLGVALLVLLPEALSHLAPRRVLGSLLGGIMLFFVGVPLLLGSWWGVAIAPVFAILFAIRARIEERALAEGLPDYADYAARVRYRLVPGLW